MIGRSGRLVFARARDEKHFIHYSMTAGTTPSLHLSTWSSWPLCLKRIFDTSIFHPSSPSNHYTSGSPSTPEFMIYTTVDCLAHTYPSSSLHSWATGLRVPSPSPLPFILSIPPERVD